MKYLVISDIHGALKGAQMMMDAYSFHGCDWILCTGDILYHGPRNDVPDDYAPKKVIEIMNGVSDHITAVRGNCEAEVDQMVLNFPCMSDANTLFLNHRRIFMTHGHIYSPDHLPTLNRYDVFLYGHTHIPSAQTKDDIFICNPGSASLPKGGYPASYGILDDHGFSVYDSCHNILISVSFQP